jgi:hypothetical protein
MAWKQERAERRPADMEEWLSSPGCWVFVDWVVLD